MFVIDKNTPISTIASSLMEGETNFIANAANLSSLIYNYYDRLNWAGFYLFDGNELVLGPFQGLPACIRIPIGKGVCGSAALQLKTQIVDDVHAFPGHIACDSASNSEIVIPIVKDSKLIGVLDIDSPVYSRFDKEIETELIKCIDALLSNSKL